MFVGLFQFFFPAIEERRDFSFASHFFTSWLSWNRGICFYIRLKLFRSWGLGDYCVWLNCSNSSSNCWISDLSNDRYHYWSGNDRYRNYSLFIIFQSCWWIVFRQWHTICTSGILFLLRICWWSWWIGLWCGSCNQMSLRIDCQYNSLCSSITIVNRNSTNKIKPKLIAAICSRSLASVHG